MAILRGRNSAVSQLSGLDPVPLNDPAPLKVIGRNYPGQPGSQCNSGESKERLKVVWREGVKEILPGFKIGFDLDFYNFGIITRNEDRY